MNSRVENVKKNMIYLVCFQVVNISLKIVMRTVFIYCLGKQYLGVSGVFSNVLSILSMTELGLGSAITYDLYKPISENDYDRIASLMRYYKRIYSFIGVFIFCVGLLLIPFFPVILTDVPEVSNITAIYLLFLVNTSSSYFFAQYTTIITASQRNYLITRTQIFFSMLKAVVETAQLYLTGSYILYLVIEVFLSILFNVCIYRQAIREFPFLRLRAEGLDDGSRKKIWRNALSTASMTIGGTISLGSDNLITSAMVSTIIVGIYSNYYLIISILWSFSLMVKNSVIAGVGSICSVEDVGSQKIDVFQKMQFMFASMYALIVSGLATVLQIFVRLWIGDGYLLDFGTVAIIIVMFYLIGMKQPVEAFVSADGLFVYFRYMPWIEAALNVGISIALAKRIGLCGVLLGTVVSNLLTRFWFDAFVVYRYSFDRKFSDYLRRYFFYVLITVFAAGISRMGYLFLEDRWDYNPWGLLIAGGLWSVCVVMATWTLFFHKTREFQYFARNIRCSLWKGRK